MNELAKDLKLKNCIRFSIGNVEILLNCFKKEYRGMFGTDNLVIKAGDNYYQYGWYNENKIINDLEKQGIKVRDLERSIHNKIADVVKSELEVYYEENKNKQLFNNDDIYIYRNYSELGKNPMNEIEKSFETYLEWNNIANSEVIIASCELQSGKSDDISYNLAVDKLYYNGKCDENAKRVMLESFCTRSFRNLYVLYKNYENNLLVGENLAYKEIAELNKWLNDGDKSNITVVYECNGVEKEGKVRNCIDDFLSDLSRDWYEEMFAFYGISDIESIKQIKGFKYRNDFYKWNVNNLLYKKESV